MGRNKKDPAIRKMDFVRAAEELFSEPGLDRVSIKDIAGRVGVTHAAFFYYYKSKEEIFEDVVTFHLSKYEKMAKELVADNSLSAIEKLQAILDTAMGLSRNDNLFIKYLHADGNASIHKKYVERSHQIFIPLLTRIVEQGVNEGTIDLAYPKETIEFMIHIFDSLDELRYMPAETQEYYRKICALEAILSRTLKLNDSALNCNIKHR
jgi:AcrR family transcriptional regulator